VTTKPASPPSAVGAVADLLTPPAAVVTLVGTAVDPQGLDRQAGALIESGAAVHRSNATAAERVAESIAAVGRPT
jgi:FdrA protein